MMKIGLAILVLVYLCQTSWNRQLDASRHSLLRVRVHICVCMYESFKSRIHPD